MYINNDEDFAIFQRAYMKLIKPNTGTKLMKTSVVLPKLPTYADFHEKILEIHEKTIHQGIKRLMRLLKRNTTFQTHKNAQTLKTLLINVKFVIYAKQSTEKLLFRLKKLQKLKIFAINML